MTSTRFSPILHTCALILFSISTSSQAEEPPEAVKKWQENVLLYAEMEFEVKVESKLLNRPSLEIHQEWHSRASEHLLKERSSYVGDAKSVSNESIGFTQGKQYFRVWTSLEGMKMLRIEEENLSTHRQRDWQHAGIAELSGEKILRIGRFPSVSPSLAEAALDGNCVVDPPMKIDGRDFVRVAIQYTSREKDDYQIEAWLDVNAGYLPYRIRVTHDGHPWQSVDVDAFIRQELDSGRIVYIPRSGEVVIGDKHRQITIEHAIVYQENEANKWQFPDVSGIPVVE